MRVRARGVDIVGDMIFSNRVVENGVGQFCGFHESRDYRAFKPGGETKGPESGVPKKGEAGTETVTGLWG